MGTGEYVCVTLRGGAPWGFTLREGEGDACRSIQVHQVEEGGHAFLAGVRDGDEVVSINGEPCADLTLSEASALIDTSTDCLQLLVKRYTCIDFESDGTHFNEKESLREPLESTTLHIQSPKHGSQSPRELYISESQDETSYEELESNSEFSKGLKLFDTKQQGVRSCLDPVFQQKDDGVQLSFSPGDMIELQVSLTEQTSENRGCTSLGSARGIEGELSNREVSEAAPAITDPQCVPCPVREPLGQHGVVLSSPSMLGQVEVILQQQPAVSGAGRGIEAMGGSVGSQGEGGGDSEGVPQAFTVTFGVPSQDGTPADEQESDSDGDQDKPNKHRPRHARLRRGESLSEKQVKEAKSKCKRIALLLTAAPPNPNNKGVLMFKKHRQRAKKYTLVSYGTGDDEPEYSDEEDEENDDDKEEETHTVEFTFLASDDSEIDKHFLANTQSKKGVLTINWDKSLLEIERKLNSQAEMECLPETKGKGALMFAQRRQRMDEISAEHEELRRQGIPVEGVTEDEKKMVECSYVQATPAGHTYMDVNVHQPSQQQYQQYQQQQYYEQQQHYQQQQQYHQQYQQQQYEQQHYQQQQMYQQQQQYNQEQQQIQHYSSNMNGHLQTNGTQSSLSDHSVKPFSVQNTLATPYPPAMSGINQDSVGQGEQIASRDERISTPAIRTGILQDTRKRNTGKPMFTFKEAPKVSPNPALLNLLNRKDKKPGLESAPEEDYLSLGAEACNFLQNPNVKHKVPPPVAPKPMINPSSLPWSSQIEGTNQDMPQCAGNSISTPAVAPTTEATPVTELEPMPAPASEPSHSPAQEQPPMSTTAEEQQAWDLQEPKPQQQLTEVPAQDEGGQVSSTIQPETEPVTSWGAVQMKTQQEPSTSWHPTQVQPLDPPPSPPQRPSWVAHQPSQAQTQPQSTMNTWTPQIQTSWSQGQEQTEVQTHAQVTWSQPQEQTQCHPPVQPSWTHSEQPHLQQTWGQHQEPMQQQPPPQWPQPLQADSESQPPWVRQSQQKSQLQPSWAQQGESESQAQPPWVQSQQAWPQTQTLGQSQPSYVSSGHPQQPLVSTWPPSQPQAQQNSWIQAAQTQSPVQPQAPLDSWASAPTQAQSQPSWSQNLQNQGQHVMNLWGQEQTQAQPQPAWAQSAPPQSTPPPNWQQSTPTTSPQPPVNMWNPTQVPSQTPMNTWVPQSQQTSTNISTAMVNIGATRPSAKPWHPLQDSPQRTPPPPPQRMHAFTIRQRNSPHVNPMATVLNPSSPGSAFEMPAVRGKGAEMFAKRQSRMEKFVVDSETVQANKATRSTSPAASLPNEWKYTTNVRAPPPRAYNPIQSPSYPPAATKQPPSALPTKAKKKGKDMPAPKPLNVVDVMKHQPYQLNSSLFIYGPAAEAAKPPSPKPDCSPHSPVQNQSIRYEQMAPVQTHNPINAPYSQQPYGMPLQQMMHDSHYQQTPTNAYHPASPYQQAYNQQYQQPPPSAYQTQTPQSPNPPYPQAPQASYQPANSHPYLGAPTVPYQLPISYDVPSFSGVARAESASGGTAVAPKPKFTAKKSAAQVWKPTGGDK